jgi:endonuclease/exonuclease/phosphatase family metal-dependent hydrolase
MFVRELKSLK